MLRFVAIISRGSCKTGFAKLDLALQASMLPSFGFIKQSPWRCCKPSSPHLVSAAKDLSSATNAANHILGDPPMDM